MPLKIIQFTPPSVHCVKLVSSTHSTISYMSRNILSIINIIIYQYAVKTKILKIKRDLFPISSHWQAIDVEETMIFFICMNSTKNCSFDFDACFTCFRYFIHHILLAMFNFFSFYFECILSNIFICTLVMWAVLPKLIDRNSLCWH